MALKRESKVFEHFKNVLIVTNVEVHARRDQASMSCFAPQNIHVYKAAHEAADHLSCNPVDLILCDTSVDGMDGVKFVQIVRNNMNLQNLPVIMVTMENRKNQVLDAIAAGCTGYVLRPYSMDTFERYLTLAKQLDRYPEIEELQLEEAKEMVQMGNFDEAIEAFEEILSIQDEAQHYYDMGMRYLFEQKFGKAIISFKKALKINDLFAEAYKGLADAYKGKGDDNRCAEFLKKAADVYAQFDKLEETKKIFIEILQYDADMPNPFNTLGVKLRKQGDYPGALHAYQQALSLTPKDENIYFNMGKANYYMGNTEEAADNIVNALELAPDFEEAAKLYSRIFGKPWKPKTAPPPSRVHGPKSRTAQDI